MKKQNAKKTLTMRQKEVRFYMCSMCSVLLYLILGIIILNAGVAGYIARELMVVLLVIMCVGMTLAYIIIGKKRCYRRHLCFIY